MGKSRIIKKKKWQGHNRHVKGLSEIWGPKGGGARRTCGEGTGSLMVCGGTAERNHGASERVRDMPASCAEKGFRKSLATEKNNKSFREKRGKKFVQKKCKKGGRIRERKLKKRCAGKAVWAGGGRG